MLVSRWFREGDSWSLREREIPATYAEQMQFYTGKFTPSVALPQASPDDLDFLIEGSAMHPDEFPYPKA